MKNKGKKPLELYLHIPFCVKKCDYCDFLSGPSGTETRKAYTEALIREIQALPEHLDREVVSVLQEEERRLFWMLRTWNGSWRLSETDLNFLRMQRSP